MKLDFGKKGSLFTVQLSLDLFLVCMAWMIAYYMRFHAGLSVPKGVPETELYFKLLPFIVVIWVAIFFTVGLYRRSGHHHSPFTEGLDIFQSCIVATVFFIAFTYFYEEYRYSRVALLIFAALHPWMIIMGRSLVRKVVRWHRRHSKPRWTLVIGGGSHALREAFSLNVIDNFSTRKVLGAILVGTAEQIRAGEAACREFNCPVLPMQMDWPAFFSEHPVHTVIFAIPHASYAFIEEHLDQIVNQVSDVRLIPDLYRYTKLGAGIDMIDGVPVISIHESPLLGMGRILKRLMDFGGAFFGIALLSPIMAFIALLIRLTSPGPILYRQQRMGLDGQTFEIFKFRTMPIDAESKTGAVWATEHDARPTQLGKILRKSSLDELPQLFNVFRGNMSLVGPRPERPMFVDQFRRNIPGYMLRHKVKAGITGWAQIHGWRGNTSIEKRIQYDLFYIQNWSIWLDLRIILLTFFRGFFNKNAY